MAHIMKQGHTQWALHIANWEASGEGLVVTCPNDVPPCGQVLDTRMTVLPLP